MKELSIEEKAKRYDEAIERATKWYDANTNEGYRGIFEDIFQELKESEDERIRKKLLALIEWSKSYAASGITTEDAKEMTAWLEKQGQPTMSTKPTQPTQPEEDEKIRKELIHFFTFGKEYLSMCSVSKEDILAWLEKQGEKGINGNNVEIPNATMDEEPVSEDLVEAMNRAADETRLAKAKNGQPFFSEVDFNLGFSNGAQWQKERIIDKANDWLLNNWSHYVTFENGIIKCYNEMIRDLNKYLEG